MAKKKKMSGRDRAKVSSLAERMASAGFKGNMPGRSQKQQKFAVATDSLKKKGTIGR